MAQRGWRVAQEQGGQRLFEGGQRGGEVDPIGVFSPGTGGVDAGLGLGGEHGGEVLVEHLGVEILLDAEHGLAGELLQALTAFQAFVVFLHAPAPVVECGEQRVRIGHGIEQGGDEDLGLPAPGPIHAHQAHAQRRVADAPGAALGTGLGRARRQADEALGLTAVRERFGFPV